jgi:histidine triad (HIT) family protein
MTPADRCLFCDIAARRIPSAVVCETEDVLGFKDIQPQAPFHFLFIPKKHVSRPHEASPGMMDALVSAAGRVAADQGLLEKGYRLVVNAGRDAHQTVDHLHLHLLAGRPMHWPPG